MLSPQVRTLLGAGMLAALSSAAPCGNSQLLYVSSYAGTITTLNLTLPGGSLQTVAVNTDCGPQPSWLALKKATNTLYCLDEAWASNNGSISSYTTNADGSVTQIKKQTTPGGPVSSVFYGPGGNGVAVAGYSGATLSSYLSDPASLAEIQVAQWTLDHPGPVPDRQEQPHPHEAITDPKGQYLLVPDLGADLVRVFLIDQTTLKWTPVTPLTAPPGSGPRHAAFAVINDKTYFYLVTELANTIIGYEVTYKADNSGLGFTEVYTSGTHGAGETVPAGAAAAEVAVSSDNKFVIVSSRLEGSISIPNFDPSNSTQIPSDPIINFSIDQATGKLTHLQTVPAGGMNPRQFSINKAGSLLGVGLQADGRVVVIDRDPATGRIGTFVAHADVAGGVNAVIFNE